MHQPCLEHHFAEIAPSSAAARNHAPVGIMLLEPGSFQGRVNLAAANRSDQQRRELRLRRDRIARCAAPTLAAMTWQLRRVDLR